MINKNTKNMNESMFSAIDLIRQDSKDVRDFVKKVFSDKEFKSMSKDTDFIKYLKSIYEGTMLDEEHVKFSNRTQNGTITTGSVQTTNEAVLRGRDYQYDKKQGVVRISKKNFSKVHKDGKLVKNGKPFMMVLTDKGTSLVPAQFESSVNEDGTPCWDTHKVGNPKTKVSSKTGKRVNNCVPKGESVVKEAITPPNSKKVEALKKAVQKINRKYKVQISTHPVTKGKVEIELGDGNHPDRDYHTIDKLVKKLGIKNYSVFNEATFRPNSGTMSGGTYGLDNRKYELKRDVKGVRIGDYTNVTLPKGTIIYNLPGGLFAHHRSLKSYESRQNKYFNQSTFRGISVRQEKNTVISIEKNSKILESVNESKYKVQISTHPVTKGEVEIELGSGNHPDNDYNTIDKLVKKLGIKQYSVFNESVNEGKYNYKADALTAYFKGKIDAKELDKIARDDFKSGIATKKELSNFLSNKFTQDVMSDTYGIPAGTLVKRVRGLMKFAEGIGESVVNEATPFHVLFKVKKDISNRSIKPATASYKSESDAKKFLKSVKKDGGKGMIVRRNENSTEDGVPQGYNPMVEDKSEIKVLLKKVGNKETKFYDVLSAMEKKYGKSKYRTWLEKSLKDFGVNSKHYDYRTNGAAEEKLFQLGKK